MLSEIAIQPQASVNVNTVKMSGVGKEVFACADARAEQDIKSPEEDLTRPLISCV